MYASQNLQPTFEQLLAVIQTQTDIVKLGLHLDGVMNIVVKRSQLVTKAMGAVIALVENGDMVYRAVSGISSKMLGLRLNKRTSLSGLCLTLKQTLRCDDSETDPRVDREEYLKMGARSMIVVPLIYNNQGIGVLKVLSPIPYFFNESDVYILNLMSELIAAAMFHANNANELLKQATTDYLTRLANRALFLERLYHCIETYKYTSKQYLGILMIDMDNLKHINDNYGHKTGDIALKEFAKRITVETRQSDTVARLGGDEFAIILPNIENRESAYLIMQRISERCEQPFVFNGATLKISASVGVAICPDDGVQSDILIEKADQRMYFIKHQKKITMQKNGICLSFC